MNNLSISRCIRCSQKVMNIYTLFEFSITLFLIYQLKYIYH